MLVRELQDKIIQLKKEKDFCILAHAYMPQTITEIADFTGDSYGLSVQASGVKQSNIMMCGVRFMAETAKMLSPHKKVFLPNPQAGCPMAEQFNKDDITQLKIKYPGYTIVAYINTTAQLKTVCDVCVTSSSAIKIVRKIENKNILFIPDCNLGTYVAKQVPEKNIKLIMGGCPIHAAISSKDVQTAKEDHPKAQLLVHPECRPEVTQSADYIGSTTGIIDYAINSQDKEFIIGTENSITEHLQYACPDKRFYSLSKNMICQNMKIITLSDILHCLIGGGEEILLSPELIQNSRRCIDEMIRLGNET